MYLLDGSNHLTEETHKKKINIINFKITLTFLQYGREIFNEQNPTRVQADMLTAKNEKKKRSRNHCLSQKRGLLV